MALRENGNIYTVGILSAEKFRPLFDIPSRPKDISLDQSRQYIIIDRGDSDRFIYTRDGRQSIVFPFPETISIIDAEDAHWKIRTEAGVYTYE